VLQPTVRGLTFRKWHPHWRCCAQETYATFKGLDHHALLPPRSPATTQLASWHSSQRDPTSHPIAQPSEAARLTVRSLNNRTTAVVLSYQFALNQKLDRERPLPAATRL
jgi:hypothetical protein